MLRLCYVYSRDKDFQLADSAGYCHFHLGHDLPCIEQGTKTTLSLYLNTNTYLHIYIHFFLLNWEAFSHSPQILQAIWISLGITVMCFACMVHKFASSNKLTM